MRGELDPGCAALIRAIRESGAPPTQALSPAQARAVMRDRRAATQLASTARVSAQDWNADIDGLSMPVRVYRPEAAASGVLLPALVYYHGGGWTIGDLDVFDATLRDLCEQAGAVVVSVDYRLGPEHRFPAAVDDAWAALRWTRREARALGIDVARLAVGGDSAGGNLATVTALLDRDAGAPPLSFQLLVYPVTDLRAGSASYQEPKDRQLMTAETMHWFIGHYLADDSQREDWRASPLLHPHLAGLPPAMVITAGFDPLRDEGRAYADRLSAAGVPTQYLCFERQIHGFFTMTRITSEAALAVALSAAALRRAWVTA